jgi:hypothetical protein
VRPQEFEMLDHRMRLKAAEIADHAQQDWPRLRAARLKLNFALAGIRFHIVEPFQEIDIPRHAPVLTVGDRGQPCRFLLGDHVGDFAILDLLERFGRDSQETADMVGAKWRSGALHVSSSP